MKSRGRTSFNSLLEMRQIKKFEEVFITASVSILYWRCSSSRPPRARTRLSAVSILYWRCTTKLDNVHYTTEQVVSILYWRCPCLSQSAKAFRNILSFNSLLEMHSRRTRNTPYSAGPRFNSLLEMPAYRRAIARAMLEVSILYWRCKAVCLR